MSIAGDSSDAAGTCRVCGAQADAGLVLTVGHMVLSRAALCDEHAQAVRAGRWGLSVEIGSLAPARLWCPHPGQEHVTPLSVGSDMYPQGEQEQHEQ